MKKYIARLILTILGILLITAFIYGQYLLIFPGNTDRGVIVLLAFFYCMGYLCIVLNLLVLALNNYKGDV